MSILVVGAGFAGAVYARTLAEHGKSVTVIDKRSHIAGNAYDAPDENNVYVHKYGPHLFHTNNEEVVKWVKKFSVWRTYEHQVEALLPNGYCVPLPINRSTINTVFDRKLKSESEVEAFLQTQVEEICQPRNAAEHLYSKIGRTLTDLFFRPYTRKMWALDLEDLDASVVKRIPLRYDDERKYFPNDQFQMLPEKGYSKMFENIIDHQNIRLALNVPFDHAMLSEYKHCFNSMPIDEFFAFCEGSLPYRSIRFHNRLEPASYQLGTTSVVNFTDSGPLTRQTDWSRMEASKLTQAYHTRTITVEAPCDYAENDMERYYPVKTSDGRYDRIYHAYKHRADRLANVSFIGRCGTYQYLDMHQVINQSLVGVMKWLNSDV